MKLSRRAWLAEAATYGLPVVVLSSIVALSTSPAFAGSYLDRSALLLFEGNHASAYLRSRLYDVELARVVQRACKARIAIAHDMLVPSEVIQAHPHLLLVLEHHERAANAAVQKNPKEFLKQVGLALDEELLFKAVLKQLGWELPKVG